MKATIAPGKRVWAAVAHHGELLRVGVFVVEGHFGERYALSDARGQGLEGVSASLVHAVGRRRRFRDGDPVVFAAEGAPVRLGRVTQLAPGQEIRVRFGANAAAVAIARHAERPRWGIRPLAFVSFPLAGARSKGLLVALSETQGWIRSASGHVHVTPRADLEGLLVPHDGYRPGARVRAFAWTVGFQPGVIEEELEPGLRYRVGLAAGSAEFFFAELAPGGGRASR